jgi:selenocysteine-specific elongation factor
MFVIGTAGHVDHGKSTLVQALTGIDPDRLREEKERGMTIDLGFAWLTLPGGAEVSIVDVPGHERFIKNMLAGVGGIDLALLVIAADEGVMPQTREHLAILNLLGIRSGVVALTKADLVEPDWLELVEADVAETLAGTTLEHATIIPCSAVTRSGLPELLSAIEAALAITAPKRNIGRPRLAIDRAFSITGFGTVVTGTLIDGTLRVGDEVSIEPGGIRSRIRGLQSHKHKVESAEPGSRTAVNLTGVATEELSRGMVLTPPRWLQPTSAVDVRLHIVAGLPRPLRHNSQVTFHTGAAEVPAKVRLLDVDELQPGDSGWAQIRLLEPAAVVKGDSFVVRSPNETLGGGAIVDSHPKRHRRRHEATLKSLAFLERGTPADALFEVLAKHEPADLALLARETDLGADGVRAALLDLLADGRAILLGGEVLEPGVLLFTLAGFQTLTDRAVNAIRSFLSERPLRAGMPREELKSRLGLNAKLLNAVIERWLATGLFEERGATLAPPGHSARLTAPQRQEADRFLSLLKANPYAPAVEVMPNRELLAYLGESGAVVVVNDAVVFDAAAYKRMLEGIVGYLREHQTITLAQVRDLYGTSRRYAQALLEHTDEQHITRRVGDERVLRNPERAVP